MRKLNSVLGIVFLLGGLLALPAVTLAAPVPTAQAIPADAHGAAVRWLETVRQAFAWLLPEPDADHGRSAVTAASSTGSSADPGAGTGDVPDPSTQAGEVIDPNG